MNILHYTYITILVYLVENVLECVFHNFHTQRKQKDEVCRGWVLNPRPSNYQIDALPTELHGQTDLRLEIMNYILNVINILIYFNSASNHTSSASVMLCCVIVHSVI